MYRPGSELIQHISGEFRRDDISWWIWIQGSRLGYKCFDQGKYEMQIDRNKIVRGLASAGGAIFSVVLSAFGVNKDDRRDGSPSDFEQENGYPEELFEKYKYK